MPANPFNISSLVIGALDAPPPLPPPPSPNSPNKSSIVEAGAALAVAGDATRCGVPARPSNPDCPELGSFCNDAGAEPSKSMSSKFSIFD
jgi:hypothetical protein